MPEQPEVLAERQFIKTCLELKLLREIDATSLSQLITRGSFVAQSAVQRGILTPADVDVVQSLLHPLEVVPGYEILELVGRGGMGVVYRAEQIDLEKTVALKTILVSNVSDPIIAARFEREAKSLARLQHPNIVQALNFGRHEGRYYFAMEYVPGRTCEQAVRDRGVIPAAEVWSLVRQVASGLMHALRQNLIHRDIKPANLILLPPPDGSFVDTEVVKIADFGLAMFVDQGPEQLKLTTGDKIMGSPAYMSLEQFGGRPVDFRTDMYSLGATAWHLLFGIPPFQGTSVAALFQQKMEPLVVDPSTLPVTLPEEQMQLLMQLMAPDPNQRPSDYGRLIEAVDALGVCSSATTIGPRSETKPGQTSGVSVSDQPTFEMLPVDAVKGLAELPESVGGQMSATIELSKPSSARKLSRLGWGISIAMLGSFLLVVGYVSYVPETRGLRTHTSVSGNTPLYDGFTLSGWDVGGSMVGAWNTVEAPDSSTAIACTTSQGALTRRFPEMPHPRISLFVWMQSGGGPIDVDFAFNPIEPTDVRGSLRLSGTSIQLGQKESDFGDFDVIVSSDALPTVFDRYHVVHIERQQSDWFVFLEEQLIGTLPIAKIGNSDAIRLVVHGNNSSQGEETHSYFADVQLYRLRPASQKDD